MLERKCSFCEKKISKVKTLIAGPPDIYICDECIFLCIDILDEKGIKHEKIIK